MNAVLIMPVVVNRDEDGSFVHPGMPSFEEGSGDKWRAWLAEQGLRVSRSMLEDEALDHPVYISYFDDGGGSYADWIASPPDGHGWFTLAIYDSEDGPIWCWARRDPA